MLKKPLFLLIYLFCWVLFFELARIFFLFSAWQYTKGMDTAFFFKSLWYGLRMDLAVAAYISFPLCIVVMASLPIPFFRKRMVYVMYTGLVLFAELLLVVSDAEIYKAWGSRIDFTPLKYLSTPKEMWASISHLPVFWILLGLAIVYLILFLIFKKVITDSVVLLTHPKRPMVQALLLLVFTGSLIIPARGGLQLSPLNQSSVYFSNNQFANIAAVNASWNFMYSVAGMDQLKSNPYQYMKAEEARAIIKPLFDAAGKTEQVIADAAKPDVIIIIWESFTEKALHKNIDGHPVIKFFPELMKEGIYFSNCYAPGNRTDKGIAAILSASPALPRTSIVNYPEKTAKLPGLGNLFRKDGYSTHFYYGGEPEFANIKSYFTSQQYEQLITKEDFNSSNMNSKWGAHDDVVMKRMLDDIPRMQQPFFNVWLTLSSHEPFEVPGATVFKGDDNETKFMNALHYTDSSVYTFINGLKKMPSWNNTIVIITADHGSRLPATGKDADDYRIPVLWLGGALKKQNLVMDKTISQLDIAGSLSQQFHFTGANFPFSKNIFDSSIKHWAFFTTSDAAGFVTDSSRIIFDNNSKKIVSGEGKVTKEQAAIAKAMMQLVYDDFLKR